ncbi:Cro/CI family transcriptional regulator [Pseudomonas sp. PH1b]|uniref:Cro/CI family transcriptional regulator n=1 Tax=Pseudomonas sp. PH1b TaxID=1397282 RepID=UPI00046827A0|nr:Cro/CI family transcriptional regulator [Pseudomonas sp. PH1b]
MLTTEVIAFFGGKSKVAAALKVSPAAISQWGTEPPRSRQYQIQVLSDGKLIAADVAPIQPTAFFVPDLDLLRAA